MVVIHMKSKLLVVIVMVSMILGGILGFLWVLDPNNDPNDPINENVVSYSSLNRFSSYNDMENFLAEQSALSQGNYFQNLSGSSQTYNLRDTNVLGQGSAEVDASAHGGSSPDFSSTNVQVQGVDEGDIVKTDGEYAYIVSRNQTKVYIIDVYPAEDAHIVCVLEFEWAVSELYLNSDKLVVLGTSCHYYSTRGYYWYDYNSYDPSTYVEVYDIANRENPQISRSVELNGTYVGSRMIGDYLYLIVNQYANQVKSEDDLPTEPSNIYYADEYDYWYTLTSIVSVNVQNPFEDPNIQAILIGVSTHIYVSVNNIYLSYTKRMSWVEEMEHRVDEVFIPMVPLPTRTQIQYVQNTEPNRYERMKAVDAVIGDYKNGLSEVERVEYETEYQNRYSEYYKHISREMQKTMIHRIRIKDGWIQYEASGGVPGYVLNRFSMDEYEGFFRIATTSGQRWWWGSGENGLANHVFVCDMDLSVVGAVRDIAPGESIYSARFMGERGYLVTFKKVDPFYVIGLSNPQKPEILGELKIPGYSNYLHPYDEDHVIGIGKDAYDMGDFAWYQGVKLSLFDVVDVKNPKEKSKYIIGDRGTESLALTDPHAFLFSKSKNLLVIPIVLAEIDDSKYPGGAPPQTHGTVVWCGVYVLNVDDVNGFQLHGKVSHLDGQDPENNWYYYSSGKRIKRTFYIEDVLYTVSDYLIKANDLGDLSEISSVDLVD
jgi:uncharacterized secreted protein with C-terminal beta-propeller domain